MSAEEGPDVARRAATALDQKLLPTSDLGWWTLDDRPRTLTP